MKTKTEVKKTVVKTKTKKGKTNHKDNLSKRVRERERVKNKLRTKEEREKGVLVFTLYKILGASSMRERERECRVRSCFLSLNGLGYGGIDKCLGHESFI